MRLILFSGCFEVYSVNNYTGENFTYRDKWNSSAIILFRLEFLSVSLPPFFFYFFFNVPLFFSFLSFYCFSFFLFLLSHEDYSFFLSGQSPQLQTSTKILTAKFKHEMKTRQIRAPSDSVDFRECKKGKYHFIKTSKANKIQVVTGWQRNREQNNNERARTIE